MINPLLFPRIGEMMVAGAEGEDAPDNLDAELELNAFEPESQVEGGRDGDADGGPVGSSIGEGKDGGEAEEEEEEEVGRGGVPKSVGVGVQFGEGGGGRQPLFPELIEINIYAGKAKVPLQSKTGKGMEGANLIKAGGGEGAKKMTIKKSTTNTSKKYVPKALKLPKPKRPKPKAMTGEGGGDEVLVREITVQKGLVLPTKECVPTTSKTLVKVFRKQLRKEIRKITPKAPVLPPTHPKGETETNQGKTSYDDAQRQVEGGKAVGGKQKMREKKPVIDLQVELRTRNLKPLGPLLGKGEFVKLAPDDTPKKKGLNTRQPDDKASSVMEQEEGGQSGSEKAKPYVINIPLIRMSAQPQR